MTDYGHDLLFGSFVTPTAQPAPQAVELAVVSDRAGLDLVTFQDHPYVPHFHDTWTLMSYAAARTEHIHLVGNVLNLPLRPPVVLARAVASLDLLSGGRIELGIGAGAFWDSIEQMGSRRLTAGESVAALDEALRIIRQMWTTDQRGPVHFNGNHYKVSAQRGPAPAHDVKIWVGALKPRMFRLVGRAADGVLVGFDHLPGGRADLVELNNHIDAGAAKAGRDPKAVRRMLNISMQFASRGGSFLHRPVGELVEDLAGLALQHGFSGFILVTDDAASIERFAAEVAPATRQLVNAERQRSAT